MYYFQEFLYDCTKMDNTISNINIESMSLYLTDRKLILQ